MLPLLLNGGHLVFSTMSVLVVVTIKYVPVMLETICVQNFMLVDKFAQFSRPGIGKSVLLCGGHFEMSSTATPLRIGFGSRQI